MALDRWIAMLFLLICLIYGYTAYFTMDAGLPPFMQRNPIWPSTLPKLLALLGGASALLVLIGRAPVGEMGSDSLDITRIPGAQIAQALALVSLMILYALSLRGVGFLAATSIFLGVSSFILGERKLHISLPIIAIATLSIWYLVQEVLGIYLRPLPWFLGV